MAYDFDSLTLDDVHGRPGVKWAHARELDAPGRPGIAAWVADMDFAIAPPIARAVAAATTGDVGYPAWALGHSPAVGAFVARMAARYGWEVPDDEVVELSEVVQGIQLALHTLTEPGDGILLLTPVYPPFFNCSTFSGRHTVEVPAHWADGRWEWDRDEIEAAAARSKVLLMCHPHNPLGRVFDREELEFLAGVAERHNLVVISDEIHAELVYDGRGHIPFATVSDDARARTVTVTSPSKPFNMAGLRWAVMHVGPAAMHEAIEAFPDHLFGMPNVAGVAAAVAAWTESDDWLDGVVAHLSAQRHRLGDLVGKHLPGVRYCVPEATYLAWLDFGALDLAEEPYDVFRSVGVELSTGIRFGDTARQCARLNFATSGPVLDSIVERMATALR